MAPRRIGRVGVTLNRRRNHQQVLVGFYEFCELQRRRIRGYERPEEDAHDSVRQALTNYAVERRGIVGGGGPAYGRRRSGG